MATKNMLIDASHPEETRVVVVEGTRVEDYDVEVASRRQLKGNIYLAKVTRVEPSLQAAFVDYGGNRHGFLAFNEIHPDYYQIPVADRERLLAEQAAAERADRDDADDVEAMVGDDDDEGDRRRSRPSTSRYYKIQEVIKRRQIMLVQVAKEERGNKGAALTSYLSLAGRYCVLMPNTSRGGGISRKIAGVTDRKRLKKILGELEVPEGMAVIVRTAGAGRSKAEIKRDYEYLVRLWSSIREMTLQSTAPTLVYEEASLIKRSIRDLYGRDIEEIIVQGEEEYRIAKEFMKLFITSHAKRVKLYEDREKSLFQKFGVEEHLDSMHQPTVQLRSGGYIVINPTEALVAIDVNSGRSTRERNIEETALRTNIEAADEIARQLRLRDLAGLIVIDFIDMENPRNQGMVERRLKEAMKNDRARVQLGRISPFGLLELSRQRLRPSLIETSFEVCPGCAGTGLRRTTESTALAILRKLEEEGIKHRSSEVSVAVSPAVALYLLNQKRRSLLSIEDRYHMSASIVEDATLVPPDHRLERMKPFGVSPAEEVVEVEADVESEAEPEHHDETATASERDDGATRRGRRRRPRRRRGGEEVSSADAAAAAGEAGISEEAEEAEEGAEPFDAAEGGGEPAEEVAAEDAAEQQARKRRRRGKRGGRRRPRTAADNRADADDAADDAATAVAAEADGMVLAEHDGDDGHAATVAAAGHDEPYDDDGQPGDRLEAGDLAEMPVAGAAEDEAAEKPARSPRRGGRRSRARPAAEATTAVAAEAAVDVADASAFVTDPAGDTISTVGGARPLLEDGGEDAAAVDEASAAFASADDAAADDDVGEASPEFVAADNEIAVVGGARSPLEDDEPAEAWRSEAEAEGEAEERPSPEAWRVEDRPVEQPAPKTVDEARPADGWSETDSPAAATPDMDDGRSAAVFEPAAEATETAGSPSPSSEGAADDARRTEVVRVGEDDDDHGEDGPRRGWWQRLLT